VLASADHLWSVYTRGDRRRGRPPRVLETKHMIGRLRAARGHRFELPMLDAPACFPARPVPMDAYELGLLLGGAGPAGERTPGFATADRELVGARRVRTGVFRRDENPLPGPAREFRPVPTAAHAEFVPECYLLNSADVRLALLRGLLDADGGPVRPDGGSTGIRLRVVSPRLREDVLFLVRSLGGLAYCHRHDPSVLELRLPDGVAPSRLAREPAAYPTRRPGSPKRWIDRIEPAGIADAVCIQVAAADSLYVTEDFLLTHNTINEAFIILDEAQNTTAEQMKMFLTRLGFGSKIVVTGDITQVDLPTGARSGLRAASEILTDIDDIHFSELTSKDVVRHRLVSDIVDAYGRYEAEEERASIGNRAQRRAADRGQRRTGSGPR
jgi:phosphate starvation-inducible PhoH-like protein